MTSIDLLLDRATYALSRAQSALRGPRVKVTTKFLPMSAAACARDTTPRSRQRTVTVPATTTPPKHDFVSNVGRRVRLGPEFCPATEEAGQTLTITDVVTAGGQLFARLSREDGTVFPAWWRDDELRVDELEEQAMNATSATSKLVTLSEAYAKEHNCLIADATKAVGRQNPELAQAYREEYSSARAEDDPASLELAQLVNDFQRAHTCTYAEALRAVCRQRRDLVDRRG